MKIEFTKNQKKKLKIECLLYFFILQDENWNSVNCFCRFPPDDQNAYRTINIYAVVLCGEWAGIGFFSFLVFFSFY